MSKAQRYNKIISFKPLITEEDKTYLRLKWGKAYKPDEWVKLEQLYEEMMESYDIQSAGHIDTLKMICKTSLKISILCLFAKQVFSQSVTYIFTF